MSFAAIATTDPPAGWGVAVTTSRESQGDLLACLAALRAARGAAPVVVDLLVNGNPALATAMASVLGPQGEPDFQVRVWQIDFGDKAHALNEYLHAIAPSGCHAFFVDGYVRVRPDALRLLVDALAAHPGTLAVTGVPSMGRSAAALRAQMLREGGIHGNLHLLAAPTMRRLRAAGIRLPLGLYRVDGTLGAMLAFDLDPARNAWEPRRVYVHADATWDLPAPVGLHAGAWRVQWKRRLRQAQGDLENAAVRDHMAVRKLAPAGLPATVDALVMDWCARHPAAARALMLRNPLRAWAWHRLRQPRDFTAAARPSRWLNAPPS
ncbi:MAG: hypothetical protein AB7I01_20815 [Gammaproteobacteria bacterium]